MRQGLILQLQDELGRTGWGEVAPLPWFGSETLEQALAYCHSLPQRLSAEWIHTVPFTLPACQFGFGSAWEDLQRRRRPSLGSNALPVSGLDAGGHHSKLDVQRDQVDDGPSEGRDRNLTLELSRPLSYCGLLPTGAAALQVWFDLWQQGYRTFKWKIGVASVEEELNLLQALLQQLPPGTQLRLDANGGLSWEAALRWLDVCDLYRTQHSDRWSVSCIEYLEQPLPVDQFGALLHLGERSQTPLALDESVATLKQLQYCLQQGWSGIFVLKPAIFGYPYKLRQMCQLYALDVVLSSVFETEVGRRACLHLAQDLSTRGRAIGFGVSHWFDEGER